VLTVATALAGGRLGLRVLVGGPVTATSWARALALFALTGPAAAGVAHVAERAGVRLFGFRLRVLALTVAHLQVAGFAAVLLAAAAAGAAAGHRSRPVRVCAVSNRRPSTGKHRPARMADIKFRCPECTQKIAVAESAAGVKIDLIVRGICCLRPGVPAASYNKMVTDGNSARSTALVAGAGAGVCLVATGVLGYFSYRQTGEIGPFRF